MAQFRKDTQQYLGDSKTIYEVGMIAVSNGTIVNNAHPLPVTLGSDTITITGNVNVSTVVQVNSSPEAPVHTHITEVGTSGLLEVAYLPIGGNVVVNNTVTVANAYVTTQNVSFSNQTVTVSNAYVTTQNVSFSNQTVIISGNASIFNSNGTAITSSAPLNVATVGGSAQGKLWTLQVAQGLITDHSTVQISGYNPTTSAGDAVWSGGSAYPWSSFATAQTLYLKSSTNNATDRSMPFLIEGLDSSYNNQTEVVTLNASDSRTAVASTKQFLRIHRISCNNSETNVGDITTTVTSGSGTVVSKILAGRGTATAGAYTIPAGYTGYMFKCDASSTAATVVNFMMRQFGKAFMVAHTAIVDNSTYIYDFPFPMTLLQKTDVYATIEAGSGKTAVNFEFLLVKN